MLNIADWSIFTSSYIWLYVWIFTLPFIQTEWQKAIYSVGGSEMKRWPLQLRKSMSDGVSATSNGSSLQQPEMSLIPERALPSSPSPLYSPHTKPTSFMKGSLGQPAARKQLMAGHMVDNSRGLLHWAQSISFVAVSMDHTLQLVLPADLSSPGELSLLL